MENLSITKEGEIAIITLDRPPANALSQKLIKDLSAVLDQCQDDDVRVLLIRGEGRFFSAGADIKEFTTVKNSADFTKLAENGQQVFRKVELYSKPIIACIHGAALGGGLELAMACHIRIVSEQAKLGLPELSLGLIPGFGGTFRLPRFVGVAKASEMLFTSEAINGKEAVQWGLANHCYDEEELFEKAKEFATMIAKKSPLALRAALAQLYSKDHDYNTIMTGEAEKFGELFATEDAHEGIRAFMEKREPYFRGK